MSVQFRGCIHLSVSSLMELLWYNICVAFMQRDGIRADYRHPFLTPILKEPICLLLQALSLPGWCKDRDASIFRICTMPFVGGQPPYRELLSHLALWAIPGLSALWLEPVGYCSCFLLVLVGTGASRGG